MSEVRFGPFCLDLERRELLRDGAVVALGGRAIHVLCALVAANGDLVTKDELMDVVWPGLTVEENNLQVQISALRKALGIGKDGQSYVVNVPGRGYRFIGLSGSTGAHLPDISYRESHDEASIAVLPFENLGGDPEHEFFADGLAEDLITDLSQMSGLFVIARHSSFAYREKSVDVRAIARNLGVRYILEGSARRAARRVRINVQLVDAIGGRLLWAERFDRNLDDVFKVQDEVTAKVVEALVGRFKAIQLPERKKPTNLEAYDLCVRGRALVLQSPLAAREARLMFERAIVLDPEFAEPHRWLAFSLSSTWLFMKEQIEANRRQAFKAARKALALDPKDPGTRWVHGILLAHDGRWADSEAEFAIALKLDPNHADAWAFLSELMVLSGRSSDALANIQKALRLNPHPPGVYYWFLGQAQYLDRQYDRAIHSLRREETYRTPSRRTLAASLAQLGRLDEARREAELFMISNPHFTIHHWTESLLFRDKKALQHFVDGYRKAGLPE
jgi:TolB-like protein/Flp pilus assembly protein TadD